MEFTFVIFIPYKPRIAVAILDLHEMKMTWSWWQMEKNILLLLQQLHEHLRSKPPTCRKFSYFSEMQNDVLMQREGLTFFRLSSQ